MGNQFFEYIAARLFADKLSVPLYVTTGMSALYRRYFINFSTPAVDLDMLNSACDFNWKSTKIETIDLKDVKANDSTHPLIEFEGKFSTQRFELPRDS